MRSALCTGVVLILAASATGAEYYVSPGSADAGKGTKVSPWSLKKANEVARPGDTIILLDGTYKAQIRPAQNGHAGAYISYRAANRKKAIFTQMNYPGGEPEDKCAVSVNMRSYIAVDGVKVIDVPRFVVANHVDHITIQNSHYENIKGRPAWENLRFRFLGDGIKILNNYFKNGTDIVRMYGGDRHLVEGNVFDTASHACLAMIGVQRSVVRYNTLRNPIMKLLELQTSYGKHSNKQRPFRYNLIENNYLAHSASYRKEGSCSPGIFLAGRNVIVRRNLVTDCQIGAWFYTHGRVEGWYCHGLRVYNNVFYANGRPGGYKNNGPCIGLRDFAKAKMFGDHVFANNIIFANELHPGVHIKRLPVSIQVLFHSSTDVRSTQFFGNNILHKTAGEMVIARAWRRSGGMIWSLKEYEKAHPKHAWKNIEADPLFANPRRADFSLAENSPCIDAGLPLTRTHAAGQGKELKVEDTTFFCDGFGLIDPDVIRVGGQRAVIEKVDYDKNTITLKSALIWGKDADVTLDYTGRAPDIGAVENGGPPMRFGSFVTP